MRPRILLRYLLWESRGSSSRLFYFVLCISLGVAAVVAVAGLSTGLEAGVRGQAKELLAADLVLSGRRPPPSELAELIGEIPGAQRTDTTEMVTIVAAAGSEATAGRSQLVELKVAGRGYPFYGELLLEPSRPLQELLSEEGVVVAPELASRLDLELGSLLRVGGESFTVTGFVLAEPDRVTDAFSLGPRLFLSPAGLERARLLQFGSRVQHRALIRMADGATPEEVQAVAERLKSELPEAEYYRVETYVEAQPSLRRGLRRLDRYLGLVALLSLLVGGVGAAQAIRAWISSRLDSVAVLKCLGLRPREVLVVFTLQALALGALGSVVGVLLGVGVQHAMAASLSDLIPPDLLQPWQPRALARGLFLGLVAAILFPLPTLLALLRVPPVRVFRRDADPLPGARWSQAMVVGALVLGVAGMAAWQSRSLTLATQFSAGVLGTAAALAVAAFLIGSWIGHLPRNVGAVWLRHGLAALARPGAATVGAMVALGLGLLVILTLALVEAHLQDQLGAEMPENAPSAFLVDIQPGQWSGVESVLEEAGATWIDSVPVVVARLSSVDGEPVKSRLEQPSGRGERWALTREQRLTYLDELPSDNRLVAGELWSDPQSDEVSLDQEFADELGVELGSILVFDVQGVPFELLVTSLRRIDWESFGINFYIVVEPGVLEEAPQSRLAAARLPEGTAVGVQDRLAAAFPNVTMLQVSDLLEKVMTLLSRLSLGIQFVASFTVLAGLAILAGAISASTLRRSREVALLKTLGMTRLGVAATFATEYALIGLVAALLGCLGGGVLAWLVLTRGLEVEWTFRPLLFAQVAGGGILLAVVAGLLASVGALQRRPVEVLRHE